MRVPPPKPTGPRRPVPPKGMMYGPNDMLIPIPPKKGGVRPKGMAYGGMAKKGYVAGGVVKANCGASMKPTQNKGK